MMKKAMVLCVCLLTMLSIQAQITALQLDTYEGYHVEQVSIDYPEIQRNIFSKNLSQVSLALFGKNNQLILKEVQVMSPTLAEKYPNIKTYKAYTKDGKINGRLTMDSHGIYAQLFTEQGLVAISPADYNKSKLHTIEIGSDPMQVIPGCQTLDHDHKMPDASQGYDYKTNEESNGDIKRTYTMAVVTTYEFYRKTGNTEQSATAAVVAAVNAISEIYENELAVNFTLLPPFIYTSADDPFEPDQGRPEQANDAVFEHFDYDDFDIGHVLNGSGGGWPGGGVTNLSLLCDGTNNNNSFKGGGWSGSYDRLDFGFVNTFAHEVGHMFGATHTWNGSGGGCNSAGQHPGPNAFEIGSGSTIMSYNGLCGAGQNTPRANQHFFHSSSMFKMVRQMKISRSRCPQLVEDETNNEAPQVSADKCGVTNVKIPHSTPFYIQGEATDDNDFSDLTYSWEQYDSGGSAAQGLIGEEAGQSSSAPLFKTNNPGKSPIRFFPDIGLTLNDRTDDFQVLPEVRRNMDFKLVARDNNDGAGGIGIDGVTVRTSEFGPFEIKELSDRRFDLGDQLTISWDTNGTEEDGVCENLAILVSYNSGFSFDFKLAEGIPYADGEATIDIPENVVTTTFGLLMLACDDNQCIRFYDLHNTPVIFGTSCATKPSTICDVTPVEADQGSADLNLDVDVIISTNLLTANVTNCGPPGFQGSSTAYTYIAVDQDDNTVRAASTEADFRTLVSGDYDVYGVSYKSEGPEPPSIVDPTSWIGQPLEDVVNRDFCAMLSNNAIEMKINGEGLPCGLTFDIGPTDPEFRPKRCLAPSLYEGQIRDSEALVINDVVKSRKYVFTFCDGYDEEVFEARVVIQEYNSESEELGNIIVDGTGCEYEFTLSEFSSYNDVLVIITDNNDCQSTSKNLENGAPVLKCGIGRNEDAIALEDASSHTTLRSQVTATIFPNPASNELNVNVDGIDEYRVTITDLTGKVVSTFRNQTVVDIAHLHNGLYLVNIQDDNSSYQEVHKFVVLK